MMQADDIRASETTHLDTCFPFVTDSTCPSVTPVQPDSAALRQQDCFVTSSFHQQPPPHLAAAQLVPRAPRGQFVAADDGRGMPQNDNRHVLLQQICQPAVVEAAGTIDAFVAANDDVAPMNWSQAAAAAAATRGVQTQCGAAYSAAMTGRPPAAAQGHRLADILGGRMVTDRCAGLQQSSSNGSEQPSAATHDPVLQGVATHRKLPMVAPVSGSSAGSLTSPTIDLLYLLTSPDPSPSATAAYNSTMENTLMSSLAAAAAAAAQSEQQQQQQQLNEQRAAEAGPAAAGVASSSEQQWTALGRGNSGSVSHLKPPKLQVSLLNKQQQQQVAQEQQQVAQEQQQLSLAQPPGLMQMIQRQQQQSSQSAGPQQQSVDYHFQQQQQQQAWMSALRHSDEDPGVVTHSSHSFHTPFADRAATSLLDLPPAPAAAAQGPSVAVGASGAADGSYCRPSPRPTLMMFSNMPGLPDFSSVSLAPAASLGTRWSSGSRGLSAATSGALSSRTITGSLPVSLPPQPSSTAAALAPARSASRAARSMSGGSKAAADAARPDDATPPAAANLLDQQQQPVVLRHTRQITCKTYLKRLNVTQYMSDHLLPRMEGSMRVSSQRQQGAAAAVAAAAHGPAAKAPASHQQAASDDEYEPAKGSSSSSLPASGVPAAAGAVSVPGRAAAGSASGSGRTYEMLFKVQVKLVDYSGQVWPVTYEGVMCAGQRHLRLTCGWSELIKARRIGIGDAITFERRGTNRAALAITLQRTNQDPEQPYPGLLPAEDQVKVLMGQLKQGSSEEGLLDPAAAVSSPAAAAPSVLAGPSAFAIAPAGLAPSNRRLSGQGRPTGSSRRGGATLRGRRRTKRVRETFDSGDSDEEDHLENDSDLGSNSSSSAKSGSRARGPSKPRGGGRVRGGSRAVAGAVDNASGVVRTDPRAAPAVAVPASTGPYKQLASCDAFPGTSVAARAGSFPGAIKQLGALGLMQTSSVMLPSMVAPAAAGFSQAQLAPARSVAAGRLALPQLPPQQMVVKQEQDSPNFESQQNLLSSFHSIPAGSQAEWMQQQQQQDADRLQLPLTITGRAMAQPVLPPDVDMQGGGGLLHASNAAAAALRKRAAATPLAQLAAVNRSVGVVQRQLQDVQQQQQQQQQQYTQHQQPQHLCPQFGRSGSGLLPDAAGMAPGANPGKAEGGGASSGVQVQGWQVSTGLVGASHHSPSTTSDLAYQQLQPQQLPQHHSQLLFGGAEGLHVTSDSALMCSQQLSVQQQQQQQLLSQLESRSAASRAGLQQQQHHSASPAAPGYTSQQAPEHVGRSGIAAPAALMMAAAASGGSGSWPSDTAAAGHSSQVAHPALDAAAVSARPVTQPFSSNIQQQLLPPTFFEQHQVTPSQLACDLAFCSAPQVQQMDFEQPGEGEQLQQPVLQTTCADGFFCYQQQQQQADRPADSDVGAMDADVLVDTLLHILATEPSADLPQASQLMEPSQQQQQFLQQLHQMLPAAPQEPPLDQEQDLWQQVGQRSQLAPPTLLPYDSVGAVTAPPAAPEGAAAPLTSQQYSCGQQRFDDSWL